MAVVVTAETAAALLGHLLLGHAVFHEFKVILPPAGLPLGEVHPAGGVLEAEGGGGISRLAEMSVWQPRYSSILAAPPCRRPQPKSPWPGRRRSPRRRRPPSMPGTAAVVGGHNVVPAHRHPGLGKVLGVHRLAHGHENHVAGDDLLGLVGIPGAGRPPRTSPITWGWTTRPVTLPFSSVWMATGAFRGRTSQPSAMAPSISSGRAVISAMRRR